MQTGYVNGMPNLQSENFGDLSCPVYQKLLGKLGTKLSSSHTSEGLQKGWNCCKKEGICMNKQRFPLKMSDYLPVNPGHFFV